LIVDLSQLSYTYNYARHILVTLDEMFEYYGKANFLLQYDCHRSLGLGNRPDSTRHWRLSDRRYSLKFKSSSKKTISTIPITNT
jgi:hypothetical protein